MFSDGNLQDALQAILHRKSQLEKYKDDKMEGNIWKKKNQIV